MSKGTGARSAKEEKKLYTAWSMNEPQTSGAKIQYVRVLNSSCYVKFQLGLVVICMSRRLRSQGMLRRSQNNNWMNRVNVRDTSNS
jgi:hypothetical protein